MTVDNGRLSLEGDVVRETVPELYRTFRRLHGEGIRVIDLSQVRRIDHAGVAFLEHIRGASSAEYRGEAESVRELIDLFTAEARAELPGSRQTGKRAGVLEQLGGGILGALHAAREYIRLSSEITFRTITAPFEPRSRRRGAILEQCETLGVRAIPVVTFLSIIMGVIVVLQSAAQLRQFGATIYVVDLLALSMTRESSPLFTAVIVAGRSGSAIAAQVATMRVTEELDALTVMALDPVRYVVVPMMIGMLFTIPVLTALSMLVGIGSGLFVATVTMELTAETFWNRMVEIIGGVDLFIGIAKSFFFGAAIVCTGSYFGMSTRGGSVGVGRSTTMSVVVSIFLVILLNALFSLLYLI